MSDNIIEVRDLVKVYNGSVRAVDGISFHVARGEVFGFLGPNGAGKSTTIKVLTTLLQKTAGNVTVDGMTLEKDAAAIRKIIGYSSQEVSVDDDLTGRENLRLQCTFHHIRKAEAEARINEILKATGLEEAADRRAGTYSGGMRKRLDLATAIITRPKLLFLDEPTTGLDPVARRQLWDLISKFQAEGKTIVLTTHYMEEAERLCDRVAIVDHGHVIAMGTPRDLIDSVDVSRLPPPEPRTTSATLEDVFVSLTGRTLRDE